MKKFLFFLLFIISTNSFADDITEFQIEGISLGDSLLDYFSKDDLKNAYDTHDYMDNKFRYYFLSYKNSKTYEYLQITVKPDDKNYIIYDLQGHIFYKNINDCYEKMEGIKKELDSLFSIKSFQDKGDHYMDPSGESTYSRYSYYLENDDSVEIVCFDMSKTLEENGAFDRLAITLTKDEFQTFITDNYS